MATGAGFVSCFFCLYPFNPQKPLHFFWRWVPPTPPPPVSSLCLLPFLPVNMKDSKAAETHCAGCCRGRERGTDREVEKKRERHGGIETDWFPPPAATVQSQLAVQRLGRTRHVPGRARLPVCGQDFPRGPRDSQAAPKKNNYSDRGGRCARSQTHRQKKTKYKYSVRDKLHQHII